MDITTWSTANAASTADRGCYIADRKRYKNLQSSSIHHKSLHLLFLPLIPPSSSPTIKILQSFDLFAHLRCLFHPLEFIMVNVSLHTLLHLTCIFCKSMTFTLLVLTKAGFLSVQQLYLRYYKKKNLNKSLLLRR